MDSNPEPWQREANPHSIEPAKKISIVAILDATQLDIFSVWIIKQYVGVS